MGGEQHCLASGSKPPAANRDIDAHAAIEADERPISAVELTGRELDREGMIKMPLNLDPRQSNDWKATLNAALTKLNTLDKDARQLRADTGRYIRPIMLIQVERTGADQRESGHIHAEDVKGWLLTAGFDEAEIAIKTAEQNDLNQPENQDPVVTHEPHPGDHHQAGAPGRLGLPLRLCAVRTGRQFEP